MEQVIRNRENEGYNAFSFEFTYQYHVSMGVDGEPSRTVCEHCLPRQSGLYNGSDIPSYFPNASQDTGISYMMVFKVNDHGSCACDLVVQNEVEACTRMLAEELDNA